MRASEAFDLLSSAIPEGPGVWTDLGAGEGVFTRVLARRLGPQGRVYAIDRDAAALAAIASPPGGAPIVTVVGDFTGDFALPGLGDAPLDGVLMANALHFVADPVRLLARLATRLRHGGHVVVVEYDRREANRWVPHPIPRARWAEVTAAAGLIAPRIAATRPSEYGGDLYVAAALRPLTGS